MSRSDPHSEEIIAKLTESEGRYRSIVENAVEGIYQSTPEGRYLSVNPALARMCGYESPQEMIDAVKNIGGQIFINPEDREAFKKQLETDGHIENFEFCARRKDGRTIRLSSNSRCVRDEEGRVLYYEGNIVDITERKLIETQLIKSEKRYRDLVDNTPIGVYQTNISGNLLYANQAFADMLGYDSPDELTAINVEKLYKRKADRLRYLEAMRREGRLKNYELELVGKNGRPLVVLLSGVLEKGNMTGTLVDITERRRMEDRLIQAQKMEAIGTLAGGIAHDFNNLLMGIQGYISLIRMDLEPGHPHYEHLKLMEDQIRSGADLSKQLLGFARGGQYELRPTDMNAVVAKTLSIFGRTRKEITIASDLAIDLRIVEVDQGQMEQVLMNLLVNAWHAMPGGGKIFLQTQNVILTEKDKLPYEFKPGDYIRISLADDGVGMDEKTAERIFDPFFTTKAMGRGTGLGLAVVYGIIKGHGGLINVASKPGQGTVFNIFLPASEKAPAAEETPPPETTGGTETILLVDDEKVILDVNRELLEAVGYRVYAVDNGREAVDLFKEKKYEIDMVMLDMVMPGMSGGETFDRIKEIDPGVKVLLCSGYSLNAQAQQIIDRGCAGFLQKPFHLDMLLQKIREVLNSRGQRTT